MTGKVYGVGVGPGDPELLTLRSHRLLLDCRVLAYPAPDSGESFARSIVAQFIPEHAVEIPIVIPMTTRRFPAKSVYDAAAAAIAAHLEAGQDVVVLCEGDPFFYGSFMYLFERLAERYPIEIVPGVSSLMASAAALRRPLAARNDVLTVVPAPLPNAAILAKLEDSDAVAIIKIGRHFSRIRTLIEAAGLAECAGYLERVTLEQQRVMPLASVTEENAPYFSIILIYRGAEDWISELAIPEMSERRVS